jgi:hypothetical protein
MQEALHANPILKIMWQTSERDETQFELLGEHHET